jgi:hypothetical protein
VNPLDGRVERAPTGLENPALNVALLMRSISSLDPASAFVIEAFFAPLRMALHSPTPYVTIFTSRHSICGPTQLETSTHTSGACGVSGLRPGTRKPPRTRAVRPSHKICYQPAALQHCRSLHSEARSAVAYLHAADKSN